MYMFIQHLPQDAVIHPRTANSLYLVLTRCESHNMEVFVKWWWKKVIYRLGRDGSLTEAKLPKGVGCYIYLIGNHVDERPTNLVARYMIEIFKQTTDILLGAIGYSGGYRISFKQRG